MPSTPNAIEGVGVEEYRYDVLPKCRYCLATMTISSKSWGSAIVAWLTLKIHAYFTVIAISFLSADFRPYKCFDNCYDVVLNDWRETGNTTSIFHCVLLRKYDFVFID